LFLSLLDQLEHQKEKARQRASLIEQRNLQQQREESARHSRSQLRSRQSRSRSRASGASKSSKRSTHQKQLDTFLSGEINQDIKNELSDQNLQSDHLQVQSQDAHDKEMMDIMFRNDLTHKNKLETLNQKDGPNFVNVENVC